MSETYRIVRSYLGPVIDGQHVGRSRVVARGLTLAEAQEHCQDPETSSRTATSANAKRRTRQHGPWFDGYTEDR